MNVGNLPGTSEHGSVRSKRTMTGSELKNFFNKGTEEIKSKYSGMEAQSMKSKVSSYRAKLLRKLAAQELTNEATNDECGDQEEIDEAEKTMDKTYERIEVASPMRSPEDKNEGDDEDELTEDDDITLESSQAPRQNDADVISQGVFSQAPSRKESALASNYNKPDDVLSQVLS